MNLASPLVIALGLAVATAGVPALAKDVALPREATGADAAIFEAPADRYFFVDPDVGHDQSLTPGDARTPLRTLARALHLSQGGLQRGENIRIVLEDGIYREYSFGLQMEEMNEGGYLVIEARNPLQAHIRGSIDWSGSNNGVAWIADADGRYYKPWPYNWQFAYHHNGDGGASPDGSREDSEEQFFSAVSRPEWVIYNGDIPLRIVGARSRMIAQERSFGSLEEMGENTVYIDDVEGRLYVRLADDADPNEERHTLEVGMSNRTGTEMFWPRAEFELRHIRNLKLSGLVIGHMVGAVEGKGTRIRDSQNVLVESCLFEFNSSRSLEFENLTDVTVRDTRANNNGSSGFAPNNVQNLVMQRVQGNGNNIKGPWGGLRGWSIGGNKTVGKLTSLVLIEDSQFSNNQTAGLWFDFCGVEDERGLHLIVRNCEMNDNLGPGLDIEISQGPALIESSTLNRNVRGGAVVANSTRVTLRGNHIADNRPLDYEPGGAQIYIWDVDRGAQFPPYSAHLQVHDNAIAASGEQLIIGPLKSWGTRPELFTRTLSEASFRGNQYRHDRAVEIFEVAEGSEWRRVDFDTWRRELNLDQSDSALQVDRD